MKTQTFRSVPRVLMSKDLVYVHQAFIYDVQCYGYCSVCVYEVLCSRVHVHGHTFDANTRSPFLINARIGQPWLGLWGCPCPLDDMYGNHSAAEVRIIHLCADMCLCVCGKMRLKEGGRDGREREDRVKQKVFREEYSSIKLINVATRKISLR